MISFKTFLFEASQGKAKWEKYFSSGDTTTLIKKDTTALDIFGKPTDVRLSRGDEITVLDQEYDTKPRIRVGDAEYRVKFIDIDKPVHMDKTVKVNLKPDVIGITGKFKMNGYVKKLKKKIEEFTEIPEVQTDFLLALIDYAEDMDDLDAEEQVRDLFIMAEIKDDTSLKNTISTDFMELLGPLFVVAEKPEFKGSECEFPELGNEPLYDFKMIKDDVETLFSSKKSGGNTNTLKVAEVLKAQIPPMLKRKYKLELELLQIIQDNPVKTAPSKINDWLARNFPLYEYVEASSDNTSIARLEASTVKFINEKSKLNFLELVKLAIPDIWYVKSKLNNDGTIKVEPLKSGRDISTARLRSKSSPGHLADKIGFQL